MTLRIVQARGRKEHSKSTGAGLYLPCLEDGVLQGASVGEGHVPRVGALVHGVQVEGGLQLGLTARQEHDACSSTRMSPVPMETLFTMLRGTAQEKLATNQLHVAPHFKPNTASAATKDCWGLGTWILPQPKELRKASVLQYTAGPYPGKSNDKRSNDLDIWRIGKPAVGDKF